MISVVMATPAGEISLIPTEEVHMSESATPTPEPLTASQDAHGVEAGSPPHPAVIRAIAAIGRATSAVQRLVLHCGHWKSLDGHLDAAAEQLAQAQSILESQPPAWRPPRKPPVRAHQKLRVGQVAMIAERSEKHYPGGLRRIPLTITAFEDEFAIVTREGSSIPYAAQRRHLVSA